MILRACDRVAETMNIEDFESRLLDYYTDGMINDYEIVGGHSRVIDSAIVTSRPRMQMLYSVYALDSHNIEHTSKHREYRHIPIHMLVLLLLITEGYVINSHTLGGGRLSDKQIYDAWIFIGKVCSSLDSGPALRWMPLIR